MFSKILDNPDLPPSEQKEVLKAVVTKNLKHNLPEVRLQLNHNYEQLLPALLIHWKYSLRIALSLVTWQQARDILTQTNLEHLPWRLLTRIAEQKHTPTTKHLMT